MSRLFYAIERAGGSVQGNEDGALVTFAQQTIECRLVEKLRNIRLPLSKFDILYKSASFKRGYNVGLEVTGILAFEIESYLRNQAQQVWKETEKRPLEDDLSGIVSALKQGAIVLQAWDDERDAAQRLGQRQQQLQEKARHEAAVEDARWQLLVRLAGEKENAHKVATMVGSIAERGAYDRQAWIGDRTLGQWIEWLELTLEQRGVHDLNILFQRISALDPKLVSE